MALPATQEQRLDFLISCLLSERQEDINKNIPAEYSDKQRLLRGLMNVRPPMPVNQSFLDVQDAYLKERLAERGVTHIKDIALSRQGMYLWQGDITTLAVDAIVNAANSQMLGCFVPCHGCIDNAIHTYAGVQLRLACDKLMQLQGHEEETGKAKITKAYNLPCRYVLHTVGPIIYGSVTDEDCRLLGSCYRSCLELADAYGLSSIAFCCISTGEFHFPNELAAEIAIKTVMDYKSHTNSKIEVIFNVFKELDYNIYKKLLTADTKA